MNALPRFLVMTLDGRRFALGLDAAERVVRMVEVTPLPRVGEKVLGVVNVQGAIVPVFSLRHCFGLAGRDVCPSDQMVLARTSTRCVALVVDSTEVVVCGEGSCVPADDILPWLEGVAGVIKGRDGIIIISDLDSLLSLTEEQGLDEAMAAVVPEAQG